MMGALNYNEQKVAAGVARCIYASSFGCEVDALTYNAKLARLRAQSRLNRRSKTNVLHVSLNFNPSEKLSEGVLQEIACAYMDKIGFGDQPYLVYQHNDAGHPHIHILSTSIKADGKRIALHNLGRFRSEKARKEVEDAFGLVKASGRRCQKEMIHPADLSKGTYGEEETRRQIARVVSTVTRSFRYTSIHELNAVLNQFNVQAIEGSEGSLMRSKKGLLYSLVDKNGKTMGIPIKASRLPGSPTLQKIERQFVLNESLRKPSRQELIERINKVIEANPVDFRQFLKGLSENNVFVVPRRSKDGQLFGLTYIDNNTRCVFNGGDLGKTFSVKGIQDRIHVKDSTEGMHLPTFTNVPQNRDIENERTDSTLSRIFGDVVHAEQLDFSQSNPLLKKKRKKRRKRSF